MFTGIIEKKGRVIANQALEQSNRLSIAASFDNLSAGESIAINGVCLTLLPQTQKEVLCFDISPETLKLTTLSFLQSEHEVNLERAMTVNARFGGHYVSGHIDTMAVINAYSFINDYLEVELSGFSAEAALYLVPKGSITVEGVSLTINTVENSCIKLMLIPHTLSETTLKHVKEGQAVNIEFDYLTKIVAHQLQVFSKFKHEVSL